MNFPPADAKPSIHHYKTMSCLPAAAGAIQGHLWSIFIPIYGYMEKMPRHLPSRHFCCDNPRHPSLNWCRQKDLAFKVCESWPPAGWASVPHYGFFFFLVHLADRGIETTKGLVFVLVENSVKYHFVSIARDSPRGLLRPQRVTLHHCYLPEFSAIFCWDTFTTGLTRLHLISHFPRSLYPPYIKYHCCPVDLCNMTRTCTVCHLHWIAHCSLVPGEI